MKTFTHFSSLSLENGSRTHRLWPDIDPLKSRKLFTLLFCLLFVGVGNAWGAVVSGTTYNTKSSVPSGWSKNGDYNNNSYLKLISTSNYIQTDDFCQNGITSIVVKARTFGGPNSTQRKVTIEWVPTSGSTITLGTVDPSSTTLTNKTLSSFSNTPTANTTGSIKISCKSASGSAGAGVSEVTITYTSGSCSSCTQIGAPTVTATPGDRQISLSWANQTGASSYTVGCTGGAPGAVTGTTTKSCTITGLTNGTSYTWTVTPVGSGDYCSSGNTAASASATPNVYYTVTWNNHGSTSTSSVASGQKPTFPATPSSCDATCTTFYGWATAAWSGPITSLAGKTIYTKASDMPAVTGPVTYYAVYWDGSVTEYTFTSNSWGATSGGSTANWTNGASGNGFTSGQGVQVTTGKTGANATSPTSFTNVNKIVVTYNTNKSQGAGSIEVKIGTNSATTNNVAWQSGDDGTSANYTTTFTYATAQSGNVKLTTNCTTNSIWVKSIEITSGSATPHYLTTCCTSLGSINGSVSWNSPTEAVVTWNKLDDQVSSWALSWSPNTAGSSITSAIADLGETQKTATVSGLACNTEYTFTFTPTLKSGVCTPASNPTKVSTSTKWTIGRSGTPAGTVTGGTFTTKISGAAVTKACNSSTIDIEASPNTGYQFSSWTIQKAGGGTVSPAASSASTTFTMPSDNVTVTAAFSCITPTFSVQPAASTTCIVGATPSLSVTAAAGGAGLSYQWKQCATVDGTYQNVASGGTSSSYSPSTASVGTMYYKCVVTNNVCSASATSDPALVTVKGTVTYDANGGGEETMTDSNSPYAPGATVTVLSNGFTAPAGKQFDHWNTAPNNSGASYDPDDTFTMSANTTLYAQWTCINPSISVQPVGASYSEGDTPTDLSVTASGGSLSYQWKQCATVDGTYVNVASDGTSSTYTPSTASVGTTYYKCEVTNTGSSCGTSVTSDAAAVTVSAASNFPNGRTIFIQAHSTSAWSGDAGGDACVKAWFHSSGGSETAQPTYWLFNATDGDAGKKLYATVVPASGDMPYLDIQRFGQNCSTWWNKNGGCSYSDANGSNTIRSEGKHDGNSDGNYVFWNGSGVTIDLHGDPSGDAWASSLGSFSDVGNGVWTATYNNYAPANAAGESQNFKAKTNYNGWIGNYESSEYSNADATLDGMHVGSTYNITATLDVKDHSLVMSKTFVKGTVHFDLQDHGSAIADLTNVTAGSKINAPSAPSATGYTFGGWYKEPACTNAWTFASDVVNETMTLYAKWTANVYTIGTDLTNVANASLPASFTYTGSATTALNSSFTVDGDNFFLPSSITVTMGGTPLTAGSDYTYNNSTGAFTFDAVITGNIVITASATAKLKSIAITTQPTTRKYLVGETFSSAGAVVTATMGDGSNKTVAATWTPPATPLAAGTSLTVEVSYTEGGINETARTTIDVYSVTVNKVAASDGSDIDAAGVTATCTTRALEAGISTTNYTFKNWEFDGSNNGLTITSTTSASTTLTGTPTGDVTIKAIFYKPITVAWKVGNGNASGSPTTEVKYGTAISALPSTPADNAIEASCGANKFMGWTANGKLEGTGHSAPADLFTTVGGAQNLTENTIYRAVFATQSSGGAAVNTVLWEEDFSAWGDGDVPNANDITNSHTGTTVYGDATLTYACVNGGSDTRLYGGNNQLYAGGTKPELLVGKNTGTFTVSGIPNGGASEITVSYKQNNKSLTVSASGTGYSGDNTANTTATQSFDVTVGSASTFTLTFAATQNENARLDDISVKVKTAGTSISNYITGCCTQLDAINGAVNWSNPTTAVVSWDDIAHVDSWTVKYKTHAAVGWSTAGASSASAGTRSVTISSLTPCTDYDFKIMATAAEDYCDKEQTINDSQTHAHTVDYSGCSNVTKTGGGTTACGSSDLVATFTASLPYELPSTVSVSIGGVGQTQGTDFTWAISEGVGTLTIGSAKQTGNIVIDVDGNLLTCDVNPTVGTAALDGSGTFNLSSVAVSVTGCDVGSAVCAWADYGFVWGSSANPTGNKTAIGSDGTATSWSGTLTGSFTTGNTYYYRAYGKNSKDGAEIVYGSDATFIPRSVTFNVNGGSDVAAKYVNNGGTVSAPSDPSRDGYTFGGWYTDNGTWASPVNWSSTISANVTYYAKWNTVTYHITYNGLEGATNTNPTSYNIETPTITLADPGTRTGYTFTGWTCGGDPITQIAQGLTGDKTITANWSIHTPNLSVSAPDNVAITATPASELAIEEGANRNVNYNKTITLNCTPDDHWNLVWDVYKTGSNPKESISLTGSGDGATFTMPDYAVTVSAVMTEDTYKTVIFMNDGSKLFDDGGSASTYDATNKWKQKVYVGESPVWPTALRDGYGVGGDACNDESTSFYGWTKNTWDDVVATEAAVKERTAANTVYRNGSGSLAAVAGGDPSEITYHAVWAKGDVANISPTLIAKWDKQSIAASTEIKAKDKDGNTLNDVTMTSNIAMSSNAVYGYSNNNISTYPEITLSGLDFSAYDGGTIMFFARGSQGGDLSAEYSTDNGVSYSSVTTFDDAATGTEYEYYFSVSSATTNVKIHYASNSGNFYFGTVRAYGDTDIDYNFTELTSANTSGWSGSDWDGYYLITATDADKTYALRSDVMEGIYGLTEVTPSTGVITVDDIGMIFKATYNPTTEKYAIQSAATLDYVTDNSGGINSKAYYILETTATENISIAYNDITTTTGQYLRWNSGASPKRFGIYSNQTSPTLYKILSVLTQFRTTCCEKHAITKAGDPAGTVTGGTFTVEKDEACETEEVTLSVTSTSTGYNFDHWTVTKTGDASVDYSSSVSENVLTMPDEAVTVTAEFATAHTTTVTLNAQGGVGGTSSVIATVNLPMPEATMPTKSGYSFGGYFSATNGSGKQYYEADGSSARNWDDGESATAILYAKWTSAGYTVTLNKEGATEQGTASVSVTYGANTNLTSPITCPTYTNKVFGGYWTTASGEGTQLIDGDGNWLPSVASYTDVNRNWLYADNLELHARWSNISYTNYRTTCGPEIEITGGPVYLTSYPGCEVLTTGNITVSSENWQSTAGAPKFLHFKLKDQVSGTTYSTSNISSSEWRVYNATGNGGSYADNSYIALPTDGTNPSYTFRIAYTPAAGVYNTLDHYTLEVEVTDNSSPKKAITLATEELYGRALPEQFVIATKKNDQWYALPNDLASSSTAAKAVKAIPIMVDNSTTPTSALYAPENTLYKATGYYTAPAVANRNRSGVRFTRTGSQYLQVSTTAGTNTMWLSSNGGADVQDWYLNSGSDFQNYEVKIDPRGGSEGYRAKKIRVNGNNFGFYAAPEPDDNPKNICFLPVISVLQEANVVEWGKNSMILEVDPFDRSGVEPVRYSEVIARVGETATGALSFSETKTSVAGGNTKYNYTINLGNAIDLSTKKDQQLYFDWLNAGGDVVAVSMVTVPWIIDGAKTMSVEDATKGHWDTEVHVLPGAVLTADGGSFGSATVVVNQLEIYPGATVKVTTGTLTATNLILRNGWTRAGEKAYDVARVYIDPAANLTHTNAYADWYIDYDQYYPIAVSFPVATSSISYKNTNSSATAGVIIRYYDGARRAEHVQQDQADNWVAYNWKGDPAMPANLEPSKGYAMTAKRPTGKAFSIVRMPMTFSNEWTTAGEHGSIGEGAANIKNEVRVTGYGKGTTPWYAMGWNFIGNPYMCTFNGNDDGISGKITTQEGGSIKYATIPDLEFKNYDQVPIAEANLKPASAFFIQADNASAQTITFSDGKIVPPSAPIRYMANDETVPEQEAYIRLSHEGGKDQMGLIIGEDYTEAYEPNADLAKMLGEANAVKTYMRYGEMDMAYVAINQTLAKQWIPITVKIPADGKYTYSLTRSSTVDALEGIYLIDYGNGDKITNLLEETYQFEAEAGTISGRFAINAIFGERPVPTDIDIVGGDINGSEPIKFLYHDKVFILHNGVIYDATGKKVREIK